MPGPALPPYLVEPIWRYLVVNMDDASQIPAMAEPLFLGMGATVQIHPVMTPEDLQKKAGPALEQAARKYG